jgi:beta-lactamase superfamily II metal-dependent hydrolase
MLAVLAHATARDQLDIYFIDVEGGQSTLVVTPARETLLIDAGWAAQGGFKSRPGDPASARDPGRIMAAMRDAGVERIDYLLVTHFHRDQIGGIPELTRNKMSIYVPTSLGECPPDGAAGVFQFEHRRTR